jgi:hypothetical protein
MAGGGPVVRKMSGRQRGGPTALAAPGLVRRVQPDQEVVQAAHPTVSTSQSAVLVALTDVQTRTDYDTRGINFRAVKPA